MDIHQDIDNYQQYRGVSPIIPSDTVRNSLLLAIASKEHQGGASEGIPAGTASYAASRNIGTTAETILTADANRYYLEMENLSDTAVVTFRFDGIANGSPGCKRLFPGDTYSTKLPEIAKLSLSVVSTEANTPLTIGAIA